MIMDELTEFADAASVGTPNNTTVNVGDVIDSEVVRDLGQGKTVYLNISVDTLVESGGAATVAFLLVSDSVTVPAVDGNATKHIETDAIAVASLVAGWQVSFPLPMGSIAYERYLGFQVKETAGQALTAGNVNAFLSLDPHGWTAIADNAK